MLPHMIGRRGPGAAVVTGGGSGTTDGGFVSDPIVTTTASGNTTVKGQVKPGSFGKFVYPLATIAAGRQYTFRYTPQFSQLAQQGKLAMVGFGLKANNDFHIVGLRGDGSTGLHKYKVQGTPPNGWNKQTGHTESDGGASANGTQAGPNYIRLVVSADGATYKFQTSPDNVTYTDEYTGQTPTPFSNVSGVLTFGIALWFNNADAGPFSIVIDQFADAAAPQVWMTTAQASPNQDSGGWTGYDMRIRVEAAGLANGGGSKVRVTLNASTASGSLVISKCYIGAAAASGDAYDFASAPTQLLFGGSAGVTIAQNVPAVSDEITFSVDASKALVVALHLTSGALVGTAPGVPVTNWSSYYAIGSDQAEVADATPGYTLGSRAVYCLSKIESYV